MTKSKSVKRIQKLKQVPIGICTFHNKPLDADGICPVDKQPTVKRKLTGKPTPKSRKIIVSVKLKRMIDDSPDTSWLGEYSSKATSEFSIDRQHSLECPINTGISAKSKLYIERDDETECDCGERGDMERGEYRYFNPGSVEKFDLAASWIPAIIDREDARREYWRQTMLDNARKDYERSEALNRGDFCFVGIRAEAEVIVGGKVTSQTGLIQKISSGGLWGVESDASEEYFADIEREELGQLRGQLLELGFSRRAVATAFKNIERGRRIC